MELSPSALNRLANSSLGILPAVVGIAYAAQADGGVPRLAAGLSVIGFVVLAVRGHRLGTTCEHARITVRGYLRTRVIDRERITEITDFPAVRWTARNGRRRWTPLVAFMTDPGGESSATRPRKERAVGRLREWARRGRGGQERVETGVWRTIQAHSVCHGRAGTDGEQRGAVDTDTSRLGH
ncbi:hypothetical protein ACICHK_04150 [Streptomyces sp. AHU1]|uniref:hypothetical protein n=1 Tax=Streptomyces sp. AHU1 TaxID=3377215 RepID=UPI003877EBD8